MVKRTLTPLPKTVKETVDFIYEYLIEHPEGISINMAQLFDSLTQRRIIAVLIKRSIIQKMAYSIPGKKGCQYKYKWVATMAPTKTLYGSIVSQIRDEANNWPSHRKNEKPKQSVKEQSVVADTTSVVAQETPDKDIFVEKLSDQELWEELKKRGYTIEDNKLVIIKKTYLD